MLVGSQNGPLKTQNYKRWCLTVNIKLFPHHIDDLHSKLPILAIKQILSKVFKKIIIMIFSKNFQSFHHPKAPTQTLPVEGYITCWQNQINLTENDDKPCIHNNVTAPICVQYSRINSVESGCDVIAYLGKQLC